MRCDNCNGYVEKPYTVKHGSRILHVCDACLDKVARSVALVDRALRRAA